MADKSTSVLVTDATSSNADSRVMPEMDGEAAFEYAYWSNSYPKEETSRTKCIQKCIKVLVITAVTLEVLSLFGVFLSVIKYSQLVTRVDAIIQFGTLATLVNSAAKIISAMNAQDYASKRTDRTPEKRESTAKFFRAVSLMSALITFFSIHMLNNHALETVQTNRATYSENELQGSHDFLNRLTDSIASVQLSVFTTFMVHLLIHFMTH